MANKKRTDNKGRVLRTGEQQRSSDGRYLYRYTDLSGKKRTIYSLNLVELREKEKMVSRDLEDHIDRDGGEMTLNQLFDLYMKTKTGIRQSTRTSYLSIWKNNVSSSGVGNMKIKDIKSVHLRSLYADFTNHGYCQGTILGIHKLVSGSLEMAVESDMIRKNPAKNCGRYITGGKHERKSLSRLEQAELMDFIEHNNSYNAYLPFISFMINTGLRVSEQCGLRWRDVDFKKDVVHVRKQLVYYDFDGNGCKYHISDLKTEAGARDIPMSEEARKALLDQRRLDMALGIQRHEVDGVKDFVFVNSKGMPRNASAVNAQLGRIVEKHNQNKDLLPLPKMSAHILRHTFASRCAEGGLDAKTLQMILGHSDISTTLNIYVNLDNEEVQKKFHQMEGQMKVV